MKTQPTGADVDAFLAAIPDEGRRQDAQRLCQLMAEETAQAPVMWGPAIVGFGDSQYTNASGTHAWFTVGFSPRKASLALYGMADSDDTLGDHTRGKACLYIKDLSRVDEAVLRNLIKDSYESAPM